MRIADSQIRNPCSSVNITLSGSIISLSVSDLDLTFRFGIPKSLPTGRQVQSEIRNY
jgi:hypothetical protein